MNSAFCRFCYNAGKGEAIYSSHYMKQGYGENMHVTCPNLLSNKCTKCGDCGHTPKYCCNYGSNLPSPTNFPSNESLVSLDDMEAGRCTPTSQMSNITLSDGSASDASLDSMEAGNNVNWKSTTYLKKLLKVPDAHNKENIPPKNLALVAPASFEYQVRELTNYMKTFSQDVISCAVKSFERIPVPAIRRMSHANEYLHAPLKNVRAYYTYDICDESEYEEEEDDELVNTF